MRSTTSIALLLGIALGIALAACAASPQHKVARQETRGDAAISPAHQNLAAIEAEMHADLRAIGLEPATPDEARRYDLIPALPMSHDVGATCPIRPAGSQCGDVCTYADRICRSARRICSLAGALPGDAWAAERCDAGKLSCERATQRCCDCGR